MDAENKALLALTQTKGELRQAMAEVKRLEAVREIAEEAVDRLRRIGDTYSARLWDLEEVEAWACIENILRGPPPDGEIRHHVLAAKLAALYPDEGEGER